jgi:hypothetical protein
MTTSPPLQKIFQGILHEESESKQNHERESNTKPQEKKRKDSRELKLHTIKPLNNNDNKMTGITTYLSILTLNVNGINSLIKRY